MLTLAIVSLTLFSFNNLPVKAAWYKTTCSTGATYYFQCDCGLDAASQVGNVLCGMPISG